MDDGVEDESIESMLAPMCRRANEIANVLDKHGIPLGGGTQAAFLLIVVKAIHDRGEFQDQAHAAVRAMWRLVESGAIRTQLNPKNLQ